MAAQSSPRPIADRETFLNAGRNEASSPAVSWAAVIGGAFVAASLSLILLSLGTGLGFSAVSPWTHNGAAAAASFAGAERNANQANSAQDSSVNPNAYFVGTLLRGNGSAAERTDASDRAEISRTFAHDLQQGALSDGDRTYLAQLVSARTGLNPSNSDKRVTAVFAEIQESAEHARKTLAHLSWWLFVALLSGAFSASYAGTIGGRQRDHLPI